ncbi:hypothetical protein [Nocardiopsis alborubida]|uniref:Uncharacterized protein n=1 Tax=Nocardiopsis alborubida TaxID=146802 RepID=A0A7X6M8X3_9ACTN|nr:hypothetical protein [Nocardiopsis alborubida]NKY96545.1 hypothetical protein [Nocardiopsis alborubida]
MPEPTAYAHDQITAALNRAVEDIADAASLPEEGTIDALNLLINAAAHYLEHPNDGLAEAVEASYDATFDEVLGWISS